MQEFPHIHSLTSARVSWLLLLSSHMHMLHHGCAWCLQLVVQECCSL